MSKWLYTIFSSQESSCKTISGSENDGRCQISGERVIESTTFSCWQASEAPVERIGRESVYAAIVGGNPQISPAQAIVSGNRERAAICQRLLPGSYVAQHLSSAIRSDGVTAGATLDENNRWIVTDDFAQFITRIACVKP